jgi:hypothetical protein
MFSDNTSFALGALRRKNRRFRITTLAVIFFVIMGKRITHLRWGQYVQSDDNVLLSQPHAAPPSAYFAAMQSCPLPPGWTLAVLPLPVRKQILTFAKNKLVRVMNPVAKLRVRRRHVSALRSQLLAQSPAPTETALRGSPMFDAWSSTSIQDLMAHGMSIRAYKANSWVVPPTKRPYYSSNGFMILSGVVARISNEPNRSVVAVEFQYPSVVDEGRWVMQIKTCDGYLAKKNTLVVEFDRIRIAQITDAILSSPTGHRDKLRKYLVHGRVASMAAFPLVPSTLRSSQFFAPWSDADLFQVASIAKPKAALKGDQLLSVGSAVVELFVVSRGSLEVVNGSGSLVRRIDEGHSFGGDFMIFDERCPLRLVAPDNCEYWSIGSGALSALMKTPAQRRIFTDAAISARERYLFDTRNEKDLLDLLMLSEVFRGVANEAGKSEVLAPLVSALSVKAFKPGDKIANAGDEVTHVLLFSHGKLQQSAFEEDKMTRVVAPIILGDECILDKSVWSATWSSLRLSESWILSKSDAISVINAHPDLAFIFKKMKNAGKAKPLSPRHSVKNKASCVSTGAIVAPVMHCERRAEKREQQKELQRQKVERQLTQQIEAVKLRKTILRPPDPERISFQEFEGITTKRRKLPEYIVAAIRHLPHEPHSSAQEKIFRPKSAPLIVPPRPPTLPSVADMLKDEIERRSPRLPRRRVSAVEQAETDTVTPMVARAEKVVSKQIFKNHQAKIDSQRKAAAQLTDGSFAAKRNLFSSLGDGVATARMSRLGELFVSTGRAKRVSKFNPATFNDTVSASHLSAHAFSDI